MNGPTLAEKISLFAVVACWFFALLPMWLDALVPVFRRWVNDDRSRRRRLCKHFCFAWVVVSFVPYAIFVLSG